MSIRIVMQINRSYSVTAPDPLLCASSQAVIWTTCWNSPFAISSSISRAEYFMLVAGMSKEHIRLLTDSCYRTAADLVRRLISL